MDVTESWLNKWMLIKTCASGSSGALMVKTIPLYQLSLPLGKPTDRQKYKIWKKQATDLKPSPNSQSYGSAQWSPIYHPIILILSLFRISFFFPGMWKYQDSLMNCQMEAEEQKVETSQNSPKSLFTEVTALFDLSHLLPERGQLTHSGLTSDQSPGWKIHSVVKFIFRN